MWWHRPLLAALALLALGLAGCGLQPLYGSTASGSRLAAVMSGVEVTPVPGRVGQRVRNELIFQNTGGGNPLPPTHRLEIVLTENITSTLVNVKGEAEGQIYSIQAAFRVIDIAQKKIVFQGASHARAGFERFESIYSNVRAREDAENRVARTIADDLKTRLAAYLSRPT
jgi:LPS-assembly lipoprotein